MKKRGQRQLLPTPQTSTTSTTCWIKDSRDNCVTSSEIDFQNEFENQTELNDQAEIKNQFEFDFVQLDENELFNYERDDKKRLKKNYSSWPYRRNYKLNFQIDSRIPIKELENILKRDFPYNFVIKEKLNDRIKNLLFDKDLWKFLLNLSTIYSGSDPNGGDRQKRNEIAFASWTTILRVYAIKKIRGMDQLNKLTVTSIILQAKLLEEADVDLNKLEKKLSKLTDTPISKESIKLTERKISSILNWKLLIPSPQVILFLCLDILDAAGLSLTTTLKLLVSKVMDHLIETFFIHEFLLTTIGKEKGIASLVVVVIETVLDDFFSLFPPKINPKELIKLYLPIKPAKLSKKFKKKIEDAIESIMNESSS